MKPIKKIKSSGMWKPKGRVWYQKNSDKYVPTEMLKSDSDEYKQRREEFAEGQVDKVEGRVIRTNKGLTIKGTKVFD